MITLLIPTLNRSEFVIQYLRYLQLTQFRGCVWIGDSSEAWHLRRTKRAIDRLRAQTISYEIIHQEYPGKKHYECIAAFLPSVTTPYVTFTGDEDFIVPSTAERCMEFLDAYPDYAAATGIGISLKLSCDGAYGPVDWAAPYRLRSIESQTASERLIDLFNDYVVAAYAVSRTEQFRERWLSSAPLFTDSSFAVELFPCGLMAVQGKIKRLEALFVGRLLHDQRYPLPDPFDWIASPDWSTSYAVFRERLAEAVAERDGTTINKARDVVKEACWLFLANGLTIRLARKRAQAGPAVSGVERRLRDLPVVRSAWYRARMALPGASTKIALEALLHRGSPYHRDFLPIYRTVTSAPDELWSAFADTPSPSAAVPIEVGS